MIGTKTVYVLGAGASNPFGFPLGTGLYQSVLEKFAIGGANRTHLLNTTKFVERDIDQFLLALSRPPTRQSMHFSKDGMRNS